ncbi:MAG: tRNA-dihydrouridine synthase [Pirellulales bacterium]|nr:tRNA-dihydrouridine synthase [Pirellulales bacterium]
MRIGCMSPLDASPISRLAPLRIGQHAFGLPVVQAALSGYSDWAMRRIARRLGAEYSLHEVVLDQMVLQVSNKQRRKHLRVDAEDHPVGGQLMGSKPDEFGPAAVNLARCGFDVIDINFGCPVKKVLGRCRGGYLLGQPATALEIVSRVRDALPPEVPVTVKMRRGLDDTAESRDKFFAIFDGAFARGVAAITVHGRTVAQKYIGPSRWEFLREVKTHAGARTVLGSGDLFTAQDCIGMLVQTGVDGVTAARGAIGNPWIFSQARALAAGQPLPPPPSLFEQRDVLREHYALAVELYGPELGCRQMRKFGIKYARLHPGGQAVRDAFVAVQNPEQLDAVLAHWYAEDLPGRDPGAEPDEVNGEMTCEPD